jgi:hypothetical protein
MEADYSGGQSSPWAVAPRGRKEDIINITGSWDSSVDIVMAYKLDGRGSIPGRCERLFSSPQRRDRLWGPTMKVAVQGPVLWPTPYIHTWGPTSLLSERRELFSLG